MARGDRGASFTERDFKAYDNGYRKARAGEKLPSSASPWFLAGVADAKAGRSHRFEESEEQ